MNQQLERGFFNRMEFEVLGVINYELGSSYKIFLSQNGQCGKESVFKFMWLEFRSQWFEREKFFRRDCDRVLE